MMALSSIDLLNSSLILQAFAAVGFTACMLIFARVLYFGWIYFLRPSSISKYRLPDAYALVTGASDGIGRGFAQELAHFGFNLVLHGRNQAKLDRVAAGIKALHPTCKVRTIIADASSAAGDLDVLIAKVVAELKIVLDGPLTVLINNCGGTQPQPLPFLRFPDMEAKVIDEVLSLNVSFHLKLTRALWPLLAPRERGGVPPLKRPTLIMYSGSMSGIVPSPWITVYAASKAFGTVWMSALGREMAVDQPDVEVLGILIGRTVEVAHSPRPEVAFGTPTSRTVARAALDRVGCGKFTIVGHWQHALQYTSVTAIPESWQTRMITSAMQQLLDKQESKKYD